MRVLYVASDQAVPAPTGGSVHVLEVARGLVELGHEVHAVTRRGTGQAANEVVDGVVWHRIRWQPQLRPLRPLARPAVRRIARAIQPDAVMERYYNFGGEGLAAAAGLRVPSVLEVNSPVIDHPGSVKGWLDAALLIRPLRRWRAWQCRTATAIVTPLLAILPEEARGRAVVVTWGANVSSFRPERRDAALRARLGVPDGAMLVLFSGSFRPWHGVHVLEAAARLLASRPDIFFALAGGPERGPGEGYHGLRTGTIPYQDMPALTASADLGVAPYDTSRLRQLQLGFYWSPLKLFEYMASGIPAVTIDLAPLTEIVREGQEGLHVRQGDPRDLADAIVRLADDRERRVQMGRSARERVVAHYSWARHCQQLEQLLERVVSP
jgi:starch synthase